MTYLLTTFLTTGSGRGLRLLSSRSKVARMNPLVVYPLLLEGVELLLQLNRKLNNNANKLGHDRDSLWAKYEPGTELLHMLCLASISLMMQKS
jgi:hypothetical protein